MVSFVIWKRSLDDQKRDEEETGGVRDLVLLEEAESSLDNEENQSGSATEGGVDRELMTVIMKRQISSPGHLLSENGLEDCLLGMMEGRRARGRQRRKYMDGVNEMTGYQRMVEVLRRTQDRSVWRSIAANINLDTALR